MRATALLAVALCAPGTVFAQQPRIAIVDQDARLADSLASALAPWNVEVLVVAATPPGATMPGSGDRGRAIAAAQGADAVVWLSESDDGWAVWVYDREDDRAMARRVPMSPPLDEPMAAAMALSIVTMLRHSSAAPPDQRLRAPEPPVPVPIEPAPIEVPPAPAPLPEGRFELAIGAEGWATSPDSVEPRMSVAVSFWPRALVDLLGVGLVVRSGTGVLVSNGELAARLVDVRLLARVALRGRLVGPLLAGGALSLGARMTVLDATVAGEPIASVVRAMGIAELAGELALDLAPILLALRVAALATPWLQAYDIDGLQALGTQALWPSLELAFEARF
jgi:hypothetical protein